MGRTIMLLAVGWALLCGCGGGTPSGRNPRQPTLGPQAPSGESGTAAVLKLAPERMGRAALVPSSERAHLLPGFNHALRWSHSVSQVTTMRFKVPVGRGGQRLRVTLKAGDGTLTVLRANVARAGAEGALASSPVWFTFGGQRGASAPARQRLTSDLLTFPVEREEELYFSFEAEGSLGASAIDSFPESYARNGAHAGNEAGLGGGVLQQELVGLATVEVEGDWTPVLLAIGDSITEGYVSNYNDYRETWTTVAQRALGIPVANAAVSGQGTQSAVRYFDEDVAPVRGVTDCVIHLGTNDLFAREAEEISRHLEELISLLQPRCRVWATTLLPKEKTNYGSYEEVKARRLALNTWIRTEAPVAGVLDFEAALRSPESPHLFLPGLEQDGIHPSVEGQAVMGDAAATYFRERLQLP